MYYTKGNCTTGGPIKNAHHNHEREKAQAKRKFLDFLHQYKRTQMQYEAPDAGPYKMDFSDYVRMLDTRTSERQKLPQPNYEHRQRATSHYATRRKQDSRIIESCQPYFIATIPKTAPQLKQTSKVDYSKMKRIDPLPLQRVRKSYIA